MHRTTRGLAVLMVFLCSVGAHASLDLLVRDPGGGADDVAHVILFYPDASQEDLGYTPQGNSSGRTWDLLTQSLILSKGAGTYTLRIIHDADTNADCNTPGDEVLGTYEITFGGGIVVSTVDDSANANGGGTILIDVLANDLLVDASSFSFGTMPCPLNTPDPSCACSTYTGGQCPSVLTEGVNYVQGQFDVTVGDASLDILFVADPPNGTATIVGDEVQYTPDPGFCGTDTFSYTAERSGSTDMGTISVDVTAAAPTPLGDTATTPEETEVSIDVLANDGTGLSLVSVASPDHGSASIVSGEIRYRPQARFEGTDRFTYTVENACGVTAVAAVEVDVTHVNHPPTANAGAFYQGIVGEPVDLSGDFSTDPDLSDRLEFRWDLNDNGRFDTDWSTDSTYAAVYDAPYVGRVVLEVRDLYRGQPTGATDRATALVRIDSRQTLQVHAFEDLDGDGVWSDGEPSLPSVELEVAGRSETTMADGRVSLVLDEGTWDVAVSAASIAAFESRGFAVPEPTASVFLGRSENVVVEIGFVKTSSRLKGTVYSDTNGNGELDENDRLVAGLAVVLDGDTENAVATDALGRFAISGVSFGSHALRLTGPSLAEAEGEEGPSLEVSIEFSRTERTEFEISWPYPLGPEEGFLQVDVEKGEGGSP